MHLFAPVALCTAAVTALFIPHAQSGRQQESLYPSLASPAAPRHRLATEWVPTTTVPPTTTEAPKVTHAVAPRASRSAPRFGSGACGGDLPPCTVMMCESHGNLAAKNPHSTASGKWQILDSTWRNEKGGYRASDGNLYPTAASAPESIQDERARQIYRNGAGRSQWVC